MKRIGIVLFALLLLCGGILPTWALTPSYSITDPYADSPYHKALLAYELTGDMRLDVLSVAFTQLGYHEGDSDADMNGKNLLGGSNFVEYNRLYGRLDNGEGNGTSYGYSWCASFISWCLRQAQVPTELALTEVSCQRMVNWFRTNSVFQAAGGGYTPLPGDIIMFHYGNGVANHTGFVVGVKDEKIYTIEGNSADSVRMRCYPMSDASIVGYCVPRYTVHPNTVYSFPLESGVDMAGRYTVTADALNIRALPDSSAERLGELTRGTTVTVTDSENGWGLIDHNGRKGWVSMEYLTYDAQPLYTIHYRDDGAEVLPSPQFKIQGLPLRLSTEIPKAEGLEFVGWAKDPQAESPDYLPGAVYTADGDLSLYALWKPARYTLTLKVDQGKVWKSLEYGYGDPVDVSQLIPTKDADNSYRYEFDGWNREIPSYLTGDMSCFALWKAIPLAPSATEAPTAPMDGEAETFPLEAVIIPLLAAAVLAGIAVPVFLFLRKRKARK